MRPGAGRPSVAGERQPYRGINVLMLWGAAADHGYACPVWMTFKQALELGGCVRKGEHGSLVVYASTFTRTETDDETGEESERRYPVPERLHGFQRRADRRIARALSCARPCPAGRAGADRAGRGVRGGDRGRYPAWRQSRLLQPGRRFRADAALRGVPGRGKLLRHAGA